MDIESARALKLEIAAQVVPAAVEAIRAQGGFSITTFSVARLNQAEPYVALGIASGRKKGDVRLAVRLQRHSLERAHSMLKTIRKRSRDEIELRFVGRIARHATRKQTPPWYRSRLRPLLPGSSIGHYKVTAGTIGAFATERKSGHAVVLSNNHVLANENDAKIGDPVLQPGTYDSGTRPDDVAATLAEWVKLQPKGTNFIDAAVAAVDDSIDFDALNYRGIGTLAGTRTDPVLPGLAVAKVGRTSGVTHGRVTAIELDAIVVEYEIGSVSFDNQIEIESTEGGPFSSPGDSGSLILDDTRRACALLFAGSETGGPNGRGVTYAHAIGTVLRELAIELPVR